uniref:Uncharacterized protein n=1 Tax=Anguilla anguilla TaxID=7936 RepID=A0A0E9PWL9_ANGAN
MVTIPGFANINIKVLIFISQMGNTFYRTSICPVSRIQSIVYCILHLLYGNAAQSIGLKYANQGFR